MNTFFSRYHAPKIMMRTTGLCFTGNASFVQLRFGMRMLRERPAAAVKSTNARDAARITKASGMLVCFLVAQILGYKEVWSDVFSLPIWRTTVEQDLFDGKIPASLDIQRHVKNIVEESMEICGYLLILFSAILPPAVVPPGGSASKAPPGKASAP